MKNIKWFLTGVSVAIIVVWAIAGGFAHLTEWQIILSLFTVGTTYGYWMGEFFSKNRTK